MQMGLDMQMDMELDLHFLSGMYWKAKNRKENVNENWKFCRKNIKWAKIHNL